MQKNTRKQINDIENTFSVEAIYNENGENFEDIIKRFLEVIVKNQNLCWNIQNISVKYK